jgi:D-glycero-beta-D-manno-heptose 1-phosphate adenylyltransferase
MLKTKEMATNFNHLQSKIQDRAAAAETVRSWQAAGETVVFTNGCFDILHYGHLHYLAAAADLGNRLVIGLNAAASVRRLKGEHRPINDDETRRFMLAGLGFVDLVVEFEEDTPLALITALQPDCLVKGGDYTPQQIVGAEIVLQRGGRVLSLAFVEGYSTTNIEQKIKTSGL